METTADPAVMRLAKRTDLFRRRGFDQSQATELAEALLRRDSEGDDRRMCLECSHLQRDGGCFAARQGWIQGAAINLAPVRTMLQRCECFQPQGV
ncbi:MAG TPA: hypothetical protein VMR43_03345 [Variovorax sp.]|nr:hypothetical protein [Variovorax sp.]